MDSATRQFTKRLLASLANNDIICAFLMLWTLRIFCKLKTNSLKSYFDIYLFNSLIKPSLAERLIIISQL